ncbi:MAG: zinc transporter ZupT [Candidatus Eisenbacteria bacterium]|nr:zinc transporter ZupT [Candidatus Eisenbacteria bacterium]
MTGHYGIALLLTAIAGLSTGFGSLLGILVRPGPRFMGASLGFAAGIMVLISFVELLGNSVKIIGFMPAHAAFFAGMLVMFGIDVLIPHVYAAESKTGEMPCKNDPGFRLQKTSMLLLLGIGIHNFPEGMATFVGALQDVRLGVAMAVAIAVHNIPEGLAVSTPIFACTGNRRRAFFYSFLSGIAEPVGAAIGALILLPFLTPAILAYVLAGVGGLMVFISLDELVPASKEYGHEHLTILATMAGMVVMAVSLWLLV